MKGIVTMLKALPGLRSAFLIDAQWGCVLELVEESDVLDTEEDRGPPDSLDGLRGVRGTARDMVVSLASTFHVARPLEQAPGLILHVVIARNHGSLEQARAALTGLGDALDRVDGERESR